MNLSQNKNLKTLREIFLALVTVISSSLLFMALTEIKASFNPSDWTARYTKENKLHLLETWDLELFNCQDDFNPSTCLSVSGRYAFEDVRFPLQKKVSERLLQMAPRTTHMTMSRKSDAQLKQWIEERLTEEYLLPKVIFFQNSRCFKTNQPPFCSSKTEVLEVPRNEDVSKLNFAFQVTGMQRIGPQLIAPVILESQLLPKVLGLEDKAKAAFLTEGLAILLLTIFLGLLALIHQNHPALLVVFGLSFFRMAQTALSFSYENQQSEALFQMFGTNGYTLSILVLDCVILLHLLYLSAVFMNQRFKVTKFEVGYGLSILCVFIGVAVTYSSLGELALVSTFMRDTFAALFSAIWIMYKMIMDWQAQSLDLTETSNHSRTLQTFIFLFFLVAYGSSGAQSAISQNTIPNILQWQNFLFLPGLSLAVMVDLWIKERSKNHTDLHTDH